MKLSGLFEELKKFRGKGAFNQYAEVDPELDVPGADVIRLRNLESYLNAFEAARFVLVGEAPSFYGCRFSGIPFTSEELLLGSKPLSWVKGLSFTRTSVRGTLMKEHSASIVWETIGRRRDIVLWNAFPWHSHKESEKNINRKPASKEIIRAADSLEKFLRLFAGCKVLAIGRTAEHALREIGVDAQYIRHPARGGKPAFKEGLAKLAVINAP